MKYEIKLIEDEAKWEEFLKTTTPNIFVQSSRYGEFFKEMGEDAFIIGVFDGERLVGGSLVVTTTARRGKFLYLPYGPKLDFSDKELLGEFNELLGWHVGRRLISLELHRFWRTTKDRGNFFGISPIVRRQCMFLLRPPGF